MKLIINNILVLIFLSSIGCGFAQKKIVDKEQKTKPNIVIILSDDQGNADAGYQRETSLVTTPSIDQLASDGVIFTNAYASGYVCAPTRAGLLTGRYQQRFGFYKASDSRQGMPTTEITLADVLRKEGYRTGALGKWHLGLEKPYHPLKRGFDYFFGFLGHGAHDYFDFSCDSTEEYLCILRNFEPVHPEGYLTDILATEATTFIEKNSNKEQPFFLYLPFNAVHWPLEAPEEDINKYNTGDHKRDVQLAMLDRMDVAIGKVITTLKKEGVYDNTIVFFLTDNGGAKKNRSVNLPLRDFKHSVYEGGLRVPFIMSWPDKFAHSVCDEPVISLDIMPTICAVIGAELPSDKVYDGRNIMPAIKKELKTPLHQDLYFDGDDGFWAVREGKWKLVFSKQGDLELYNLDADISEENNLADQYPDIVKNLDSKYRKWRKEMGTPMEKKG